MQRGPTYQGPLGKLVLIFPAIGRRAGGVAGGPVLRLRAAAATLKYRLVSESLLLHCRCVRIFTRARSRQFPPLTSLQLPGRPAYLPLNSQTLDRCAPFESSCSDTAPAMVLCCVLVLVAFKATLDGPKE